MTEITFTPTFSIDAVIAFLAIFAASYFAYKQVSIMDKQREIFERQRQISEDQKFYQGQQTTISQQQARLLSQQLAFIREQETDRRNKEELYMLIAPLYTSFKKDDDIIEWMSLRETDKMWRYKDNPLKEAALKNLEVEILELMRQKKGLAHEPLYSQMDAFEKQKPNWIKNRSEMKDLLDKIFASAKIRYNELIGQ
jgi:hypothetical protein